MDDLGDKINSILNDPESFGRIAQMAKSIMGGEPGSGGGASNAEEGAVDPAMLTRLAGIMQRSGAKSEKRALLEAMKPYLSEKRRRKMDKALKIAKLASIAGLAVSELGEDGDV